MKTLSNKLVDNMLSAKGVGEKHLGEFIRDRVLLETIVFLKELREAASLIKNKRKNTKGNICNQGRPSCVGIVCCEMQ